MRQFNKLRNTKGLISLWQDQIRWRDMRNHEEVERRVRILTFWQEYGFEATQSAYGTSRRTLFRWQKNLREGKGYLESLDPKSRTPRNKRKRVVPDGAEELIIAIRREHKIGKEKLESILLEKGYNLDSSKIGRILSDLKKRDKLPNPRVFRLDARTGRMHEKTRKKRRRLRRPRNFPYVQTDTVVRYIDGLKRYILTGIHTTNKNAFAGAYLNHSSKSAADFLSKYQAVSPAQIEAVQTDNGSEFDFHFAEACRASNITHFHTYPRSPKMNAVVERFNRTLDEGFIQPNRALLRDDIQAFNEKLAHWLLWYNTERPHHSLGQVPPMKYILQTLPARERHMWWTHTTI